MEIRFCDRCSESIPDADFDSGRAVTVDGAHFHVSCALTRSLSLSGRRSWLTFALALYAAGVTTFLLVAALGRQEDPNHVPLAVNERIDSAGEALRDQVRAERDEVLANAQKNDRQRRVGDAEDLRAELKRELETQRRRIEETDELAQAKLSALTGKVQSLERELGNVFQLVRDAIKKVEAEAALRMSAAPEPAPQPTPQPTPEPTPPPEMPPAMPTPADGGAAMDEKHEAQLKEWIGHLKNPNENIRFSATLQLGQLNDLRAVQPLVEVLNKDRDYYVRLGSATALGDMKACDAVPALIDALDDKDTLVRTAADDALKAITEHVIEFLAEDTVRERRKAQKDWRTWWQENEVVVRRRLGQSLATPGG